MAIPSSLLHDHRLIRSVLRALESFVERIQAEESVERGDLKRFADFFERFVSNFHALKEELVLLPALARAGSDWQAGPVASARREHRKEQYFTRVMQQLAAQEQTRDPDRVRVLLSELQAFLDTMRHHLELEQAEVFPLIEQLEESQHSELCGSLDQFDNNPQSREEIPQLRQLAEQLTRKYTGEATQPVSPSSEASGGEGT